LFVMLESWEDRFCVAVLSPPPRGVDVCDANVAVCAGLSPADVCACGIGVWPMLPTDVPADTLAPPPLSAPGLF
jgi:hypothetical protein